MPYGANSELPQAVRDAYSSRCQTVFRNVWNEANSSGKSESSAFAIAHTAAKRCEGGKRSAMETVTGAPGSGLFKIYARRLIASRSSDGRLRLEGIASSTVKDHHGDQMTLKALRKMAASSMGMTIFMNHEYRVPQDVFGSVEKADVVDSGERDKSGEKIYDMRYGIGVASTNPDAVKTFELIEQDKVKLGLSVGAMLTEAGTTFDKTKSAYMIDDAEVVEASVIGIPANPRSWVDYAVKSLVGRYPSRMKSHDEWSVFVKDLAGLPEAVEVVEEPEEAEEPLEREIPEREVNAAIPALDESGFGEDHYRANFEHPDLVDTLKGLSLDQFLSGDGVVPELQKAEWSTAYVNDLPDSAFACAKERKYPHHDKNGKVDAAHVRNALSRLGDESNSQCGAAHIKAHASAMGIGVTSEKGLEPDLTAALADGNHQHPHAHVHGHEHEHGWGDSNTTVHDHEHAHIHSHEHDSGHEHRDEFNDYGHNHDHNGSYDDKDHAHSEDAMAKKALTPDTIDSRVTIWETDEGKTIEINTGRASPKGDGDQSAQDSENAGGQDGASKATKSLEDEGQVVALATTTLDSSTGLLKAMYGQLQAARAENVMLRASITEVESDRDAAIEIAGKTVLATKALIERIGQLPAGRKTADYVGIQKDFDGLEGIYDEDVRYLMRKK